MAINISQQMKKILEDYTDEVMEVVIDELTDVASDTATELKSAGGFKGTKYRGSWDSKVETKRTFTSAVVYNKKHYRLTHLLEYGHAKKNGGRTRAFAHIEPANTKAETEAIKRITKAIERLRK